MPSMTKRVNVYTQVAIRNVTPPIHGTYKDIIMTTGDILKCLCKRARVEEIMPDGKVVRLNMRNYYTDNGAGLDASKSVTKEVKKVEEPARFKVPVAPKAQVVETKTSKDINQVVIEETKTDFASKIEEPAISLPVEHLENNVEHENKIEVTTEDNAGGIVGIAEETNVELINCNNSEEDENSVPVIESDTTSTNNNQNNYNHNKKKHKK